VSQLSGGAVDAEFACKLVDRMPLATTAPTCSNCNHAITHDALAPNSFFVSKKMCGTVSPRCSTRRLGRTVEHAFRGCHWLCQCQCGFNREHPVAGHGSTASRAPAAWEVHSSHNGLTTISSRQLFRTIHVVGDSRGDTRSNE
jgi:hypothetical protein